MSWTKSYYEGKGCWERSDGTRVFSTQEVTAIENMERMEAEKRKGFKLPHYDYDDYEIEEEQRRIEDKEAWDSLPKWGKALVIIVQFGFLSALLISVLIGL
jgi:hypothetical protein